MKIAQIAGITESVPPKKYGGTERIVGTLSNELVRRGHEVTLFATGDSRTLATLHSTYPDALRKNTTMNPVQKLIWGNRHIATAYTYQSEFDIIHDHTGWLGASVANSSKTPVVMTLHGVFTQESIALFESVNNPYLVSISDSQRKPAPDLNYIATVYNGLSMSHYPFSNTHDGYLVYVGRFCYEKSPHLAIEVAKALDLPLFLAAKLEDGASREYFEKYIKSELTDTIRWVGEVNEEERNLLFSRALCSLHPVSWPEPFGLTLIEAMACGTPVIAFNKGAIPEVIKHGKTGFIVNTVTEMIQAVSNIAGINRASCRQHALTTFPADRMVDEYEFVYRAIVEGKKQRHYTTQPAYTVAY